MRGNYTEGERIDNRRASIAVSTFEILQDPQPEGIRDESDVTTLFEVLAESHSEDGLPQQGFIKPQPLPETLGETEEDLTPFGGFTELQLLPETFGEI